MELRESGKTLNQSESNYRELAELLPLFVYTLETTGNFTFMNRAGVRRWGTLGGTDRVSQLLDKLVAEETAGAAGGSKEVLGGVIRSEAQYTLLRRGRATFPLPAYSSPNCARRQDSGHKGSCLWEEKQVRGRDGSIFQVHCRPSMVMNDNGRPVCLMAS